MVVAWLLWGLLIVFQVPDKREILTKYRGWAIKVKVSCLSEQINVEAACVLQGLGVDSGARDPLYCEADLIQGRQAVDANKVPSLFGHA